MSSNKLRSNCCASEVPLSEFDLILEREAYPDSDGNVTIDISCAVKRMKNGYYEGFFIVGCDVSNVIKMYFGVNLVMDVDRLISKTCLDDNTGCNTVVPEEKCCVVNGQPYLVQSVVNNVMVLRLAHDADAIARSNNPTSGNLAYDYSIPGHVRLVKKCNTC
jgi:hypothetical protein